MRQKIDTKSILLIICLLFPIVGICQNAGIKVQTIPSSTILLDSAKKDMGHEPFDFQNIVPEMRYSITSKGYDPLYLMFDKEKKRTNFPNNLIGCYPCLMEFNQSPLDENINPIGKFKLRKKIADSRISMMVAIMTPQITISPNTVIASINGHKIKLSNSDIHLTMGYMQNMMHPLIVGFEGTYLDAYDIDSNKDKKTRLYKPKIVVKPIIKKLEYNLEGKLLRDYVGPALLNCEWQFYSINDTTKMLGNITTETSMYRIGKNYDLPMHQLIAEASRDLAGVDTLYSFLKKVETKILDSTIPTATIIKRGAKINFTSQKEMLKSMSHCVVTIENDEGFGSGVIIDPSGLVLTNHHVVIDDTSEIRVKVQGIDELLVATIVSMNSDFDVAIIKLPVGNYQAISLSLDDSLETGDIVYAIGTPLDKTLGQSVTKGIVSGFRTWNGVRFIQTDVSINAGNSGGPLITEDGKFMGIATMKATGKGIEGLGFCIPASTIVKGLNLKF